MSDNKKFSQEDMDKHWVKAQDDVRASTFAYDLKWNKNVVGQSGYKSMELKVCCGENAEAYNEFRDTVLEALAKLQKASE